jgi:peroxiredoxin
MNLLKKITIAILLTCLSAAQGELEQASAAPEFALPNLEGQTIKLSDFRGKPVVLEWFNQGCPFVKKHYESGSMQKLQSEYGKRGVTWLTIVSSAPGKQGNMSASDHKKVLKEWDAHPSHLLIDEDGTVGRNYFAKTTPHMFILSPNGTVAYQGAIDDIRSTDAEDVQKAKNYVAKALNELLSNSPISEPQTIPYGCSVKY